MDYLTELLNEGWGITIGLSPLGYWTVIMAEDAIAVQSDRYIRATNSGTFTDLNDALRWCKEALDARGIRPYRQTPSPRNRNRNAIE